MVVGINKHSWLIELAAWPICLQPLAMLHVLGP